MELNSLASTVFDLSPLDLSQDRAINPQYIRTTNVDSNWFMNQVKSRYVYLMSYNVVNYCYIRYQHSHNYVHNI